MRRHLILAYIILLTVVVLLTGCQADESDSPVDVTFNELLVNPEHYEGKLIVLEGYYFSGFETNVIAKDMTYSGYAEEHLIPDGEPIWINGGVRGEIYDQLNRQNMMGPEERYGRVRITGTFEYGEKYGHLGGFNYQITLEEAEILPWALFMVIASN